MVLPITSYGGMGMRTYIRKVAYGQRLKRYPLSSIVRPCTMLDNEFDQMSNSLLTGCQRS